MLKKGDVVTYNKVDGKVIEAYENESLIELQDGQEYMVLNELLETKSARPCCTGSSFKSLERISKLAEELSEAGVSEVHIKDGKVMSFISKETLDEKIKRYRDEATKKATEEAEAKARKEWEDERAT